MHANREAAQFVMVLTFVPVQSAVPDTGANLLSGHLLALENEGIDLGARNGDYIGVCALVEDAVVMGVAMGVVGGLDRLDRGGNGQC